MPSITNDSPPMNEIVLDGVNGICVDSVPWGEAGSGIPAFDPDFDQLTAAIERLGDADERERLRRGRPASCATASAAGSARSRACAAAARGGVGLRAMRVGVVSKWFNRGQPVVGRQTALGGRRARP